MPLHQPNGVIRSAEIADSAAIGRILAQGWRQAYAGFMSEDELGPRVDPEHRKGEIEAWLSTDFDPDSDLLLVAERDGEVVGFLGGRLGDRNDVGAASRITLLYVAPEHQGAGIGRALLLEAVEWLIPRAPGPISIGAFEQNPFRSFYSVLGGREAQRIMVKVDASEWPVVIYLWPSLQALREGIRAKGF